jgi:signal transduction histidine kinase
LIFRSLRWRLLAGAAAAIFIALALAWIFMTVLFERHLERRLADELRQDGLQLVAAISLGADRALSLDNQPIDPRYTTPSSGKYWQVSVPGGASLQSRSLWDQTLPTAPRVAPTEWRTRRVTGPFRQQILIIERIVEPNADGRAVLVQVAEDADSVTQARTAFGGDLALYLTVLWFALSLAAWVQVSLGLAPLRRIRAQVQRLERSASERLDAIPLDEVQPLISAINTTADAREDELQRARRRAADLAHSLKTPLAAIAAQSRRARETGATEAADGINAAVEAMKSALESELARSRIATVRRQPSEPTPALPLVERLVSVLEHTERGGELAFEINIAPSVMLPIDSEDLTELLGPLLENAVRYASRMVRIAVDEHDDVIFTVEDDGPGMTEEQTAIAMQRGVRLDQTGSAGLGLAIAREIADATGGSLTLARSQHLRGLSVSASWRRMAQSQ